MTSVFQMWKRSEGQEPLVPLSPPLHPPYSVDMLGSNNFLSNCSCICHQAPEGPNQHFCTWQMLMLPPTHGRNPFMDCIGSANKWFVVAGSGRNRWCRFAPIPSLRVDWNAETDEMVQVIEYASEWVWLFCLKADFTYKEERAVVTIGRLIFFMYICTVEQTYICLPLSVFETCC